MIFITPTEIDKLEKYLKSSTGDNALKTWALKMISRMKSGATYEHYRTIKRKLSNYARANVFPY